jgi:hypothetical protein
MFQPNKKINLNEGRNITDGNITYGGFPRALNEAKKLAKKDYNKNGKLESSEVEYLGARDNAIKANMGKKVEESFDATDFEVVEELLEELFDENELDLIIEAAEKKKWIQKAIKKEGSLRKTLKVKKGEKIPEKKLEAAAKKGGKTGKRARLAMTLKKLNESRDGKMDHGQIADLFIRNSHEGTDFTPETYPLLPKDLHNQLVGLVGDEVSEFERTETSEIPSTKPGLSKSLKQLETAVSMLDKSGHGKHPAAVMIDTLRDRYLDAHRYGQK